MKRFLLSAVVIVTFLAYSLQRHLEGSTVAITSSLPTGNPAPVNYKDGQYTGVAADAYYGNVQAQITVAGGKVTDVVFLDYPHDRRTSLEINSQAMPMLKQEAIQAQTARIDVVSGATQTSRAFIQSLESALSQAV